MLSLITYLLYFLAIYLGLTILLFAMARFASSGPAAFYARLLASYGSLLLCAMYGTIASLILRLAGKHRIAQWATARSFYHVMYLTTGIRFVIVSGKEHLEQRPVVFIGNHQSALDVLLLGTVFPPYCSVTAKKSLAKVPFLGWFMALSGTVFIDRANRDTAMKAFDGAAEEMRRERQSVFIFPEGTRSYATAPMLLGFKKGAFHLAIKAGVDVVPIVAGCYWGMLGASERRFLAGDIPVKGEWALPFPLNWMGLKQKRHIRGDSHFDSA